MTNFFATRSDLEPAIPKIDAKLRVKYVEDTFYYTPQYAVYSAMAELPQLGIATDYTVHGSRKYIVLPLDDDVNVQPIHQTDGKTRYDVKSINNPEAFLFLPGGWYEGCLIGGWTATTQNHLPEARARYRQFSRVLTWGFAQIEDWSGKPWRVGPEALECLRTGVRLVTNSAHAATTNMDLVLPENLR